MLRLKKQLQVLLAVKVRELTAPPWISTLREEAKKAEKSVAYDIKIYDSLSWRRKRFSFDKDLWNPIGMSSVSRKKLCLGDEHREYTVIGEAFPFPDREDSPVINEPSKLCTLLWDHNSSAEKLLIQLSDYFPPLLWHTIKPKYEAVSRIFSEFVEVDAEHMKKYLPYYEEIQHRMETLVNEKLTDSLNPSYIKNKFIEDMRKKDPRTINFDYDREHNVYLGTFPHFRLVEDRYMKSNPFVFGWPLLLSDGNDYVEDTALRVAAFRSVFSKSLIFLHSRMDLQIDHRQTHLVPNDNVEDVLLEMPVFCTVNYPKNQRLCGGRPLVERFNQAMGTSYPSDMPVDVLGAFAMENTVKGQKEVLEELHFLVKASEKAPDVERVFRLSEDQLSCNRIVGQLAYNIVYLALLNYNSFEKDIFSVFCHHPSDLVRVACAKGAFVLARPDLVEMLIANEPEGRAKDMLKSTLSMVHQPKRSEN